MKGRGFGRAPFSIVLPLLSKGATMPNDSTMFSGSSTARGFAAGWTRPALVARARAAGVSLSLSALIVGSICATLALAVHTLPYFWASGGVELTLLVACVDLAIGPLLTFLVYDRRKSSLRRDLVIVACIQLLALGYGVHASLLARPVFLTFVVDRFELVSAAEVDADELRRAPPEFRKLSYSGPRLAAARAPTDPRERETLMFASTTSGIDRKQVFRYYVELSTMSRELVEHAKPLDRLARFNPEDQVERRIAPYVAKLGSRDSLGYLPVQGRREDLAALIDLRDGSLLAVLRLKPWS